MVRELHPKRSPSPYHPPESPPMKDRTQAGSIPLGSLRITLRIFGLSQASWRPWRQDSFRIPSKDLSGRFWWFFFNNESLQWWWWHQYDTARLVFFLKTGSDRCKYWINLKSESHQDLWDSLWGSLGNYKRLEDLEDKTHSHFLSSTNHFNDNIFLGGGIFVFVGGRTSWQM